MATTPNRKVFTQVIVSTSLLFIGYLLRYALNAFLTRNFTPAFYGDFSIGIRVLFLASSTTLLGTNSSVHRFFSSYLRDKNHDQVTRYLHWNFAFIFRSFLICIGLAALLFLSMLVLDQTGIKNFASYHLAIYMLWIAPLSAVALLFFSLLIGVGKPRASTFISSIFRTALTIVFYVTAFLFLDIPSSNILVISIVVLVLFFMLLSQGWLLSKNLGPLLFSAFKKSTDSINSEDTSNWKKVSLKLATASFICLLVTGTDLIIIETIHPHEDNVGFYAAILMISGLIPLLSAAAYQSFRPIVSNLIKTPEGKVILKNKLRIINIIFFCTIITVDVLLITFGHQCLAIFGPQYIHTYPVLVVSIIAMSFISCATSSTILLSCSGGEKTLLIINLCELSIVIVFGIIFTLWLGLLGMAIATLIAGITKSVLFINQSYRFTHIKALTII